MILCICKQMNIDPFSRLKYLEYGGTNKVRVHILMPELKCYIISIDLVEATHSYVEQVSYNEH